MSKSNVLGMIFLSVLFGHPQLAYSATAVYFDRDAFYAQLGIVLIDDYEALGYTAAMIDVVMSNVLGEATYTVLSGDPNFPSHIVNANNANAFSNAWCNGCNLDTMLGLTSTSVGDPAGVTNVGFDIVINGNIPYNALVTFGDGSVGTYALPIITNSEVVDGSPYMFWGISSSLKISSVQLLSTSTGSFLTAIVLDNLVIGGSGGGITPPPFQVHGSPVLVTIEIEPRKDGQIRNPTGGGKIEVAILSTAEFDAMTVNGSTLTFGPNNAAPTRVKIKDTDRDGDLDFVASFDKTDTGIQCGDTEATLTGQTNAAGSFEGTDSIITIGHSCQ